MKKILLLEGSSLTSRETLNILKQHGYAIDIVSPALCPISLFSRKKHRILKVKNINQYPKEYLRQMNIIIKRKYSLLLPTHEETWFFSAARKYLPDGINIVLPPIESILKVQSKINFAKLLDKLEIPQPDWQVYSKGEKLNISFPLWVKRSYSTAGIGAKKVENIEEFARLLDDYNGKILLQKNIDGKYGQTEAVFSSGRMVGVHTSIQTARGVGGSAAARISVDYISNRKYIQQIGQYLNWNGCITLDFIHNKNGIYFIECNPRLVEPGNAARAGVDFPKLILDISEGKTPKELLVGKKGIRTHGVIAVMLGTAQSTRNRKEIFKKFMDCIFHKGIFEDSAEVLTPVKQDLLNIVPIMIILLSVLINPKIAKINAVNVVKYYSVKPRVIEWVLSLDKCDRKDT